MRLFSIVSSLLLKYDKDKKEIVQQLYMCIRDNPMLLKFTNIISFLLIVIEFLFYLRINNKEGEKKIVINLAITYK